VSSPSLRCKHGNEVCSGTQMLFPPCGCKYEELDLVNCPDCSGRGQLFGGQCAYCEGVGRVPRSLIETVEAECFDYTLLN
jgi:hypothetical protein